jgi:hypothetical protein
LTAEGTTSKGRGSIACEVEFCIFYRLSLRTLRTKDVIHFPALDFCFSLYKFFRLRSWWGWRSIRLFHRSVLERKRKWPVGTYSCTEKKIPLFKKYSIPRCNALKKYKILAYTLYEQAVRWNEALWEAS